jgi:hypothetical protein
VYGISEIRTRGYASSYLYAGNLRHPAASTGRGSRGSRNSSNGTQMIRAAGSQDWRGPRPPDLSFGKSRPACARSFETMTVTGEIPVTVDSRKARRLPFARHARKAMVGKPLRGQIRACYAKPLRFPS